MAKTDNAARAQAAANTRKLIDWAADAVSKPLPDAVRRRAAIILSDDIGAMVAGSLETQVARAREGLLRTSSAKAEATVLARGAPRARLVQTVVTTCTSTCHGRSGLELTVRWRIASRPLRACFFMEFPS